ncbi:MAG: RNA polymerase sigma factor [Ktedonobacteraceae bacterium]
MSDGSDGSADLAEKHAFLSQFLQENATRLQGIIRSYVARSGLASGSAVQAVAHDVFQDMALEALAHADKLNLATLPWAWLLAIALNILKRKKSGEARRSQREVLLSNLLPVSDIASEWDFLDQLSAQFAPGPEQLVESDEQVQEILALVSTSDAEVLRLAIVDGLNTEQLASSLDVNAGAARVRLYRALRRLRAAWQQREEQGDRR